jgi:hypothetical protein
MRLILTVLHRVGNIVARAGISMAIAGVTLSIICSTRLEKK